MKKIKSKIKQKKNESKTPPIPTFQQNKVLQSSQSVYRQIIAQCLLVVGLFGACLTLIGNLQTIIFLANWVHVVTKWWFQLSTTFWSTAAGWVGLKVYPETITLLTFYLMLFAICFSGLISKGTPGDPPKTLAKQNTNDPKIRPYLERLFVDVNWALATSSLAMLLFWIMVEGLILNEGVDLPKMVWLFTGTAFIWVSLILLQGWSSALKILVLSFMIAAIYSIITIPAAKLAQSQGVESLDIFRRVVLYYSAAHFSITLGGYLSWATPDFLLRRLSLLLLIVVLLLSLNWISVVGIDIEPPSSKEKPLIFPSALPKAS